MKIFVTGGTGFIGSQFLKVCLGADHEVIALRHNNVTGQDFSNENRLRWIGKRLEDVDERDLMGCDVVVHLAACGVSPRTASWSDLLATNVINTIELFRCAAKSGVRRWFAAGTFAEYGLTSNDFEFIPPGASLLPTTPYASSKAAAYTLLVALAKQEHSSLHYLRIASVFGDGQHVSNLWPSLKKAACSGDDFAMTMGEQVRDYVPVSDVARQILDRVTTSTLGPGMIRTEHLGSGIPQTIRTFCEHWWKQWGARGTILYGRLPYREFELMRCVQQIGWKDS
ncbi:MAG: NAD-dependent epimerase/dehydratase family protein [Planctomycetota bacterium]|nr:NAD-dependent epimerase/dehydratase family protein [Planctomycetota bacterium]